MIRISKMADYAVVILAALAGNNHGMMSAALIAQETHLPEPTVSKILKYLAKAEIVKSTRGTNGGYVLQETPKAISVAKIITAVDGPITIVACADGITPDCSLTDVCGVRGRWDDVNQAICSALEDVTLADMIKKKSSRMAARDEHYGRH